MCNLNIVVKTKCKTEGVDKTIEAVKFYSFLTGVTSSSYETNDEGDGLYLDDGTIIKGKNKIDYTPYIKKFIDSNFIITHQRIATSGKTEKYIQPFENDDFVLVHNGIMREFEEGEHSDTFVFFNSFVEEFNGLPEGKNKKKKRTRTKRVVKAINNVLNKKTGGYYSIAIFDKKEKELYYFKSWSTDINFYRDDDKKFLYITTSKDNKIFLFIYPEKFNELKIEPMKIYKVMIDDCVRVYVVGEIKINSDYNEISVEGTQKYASSLDNLFNRNIGTYEAEEINEGVNEDIDRIERERLTKIKDNFGVFVTSNAGYCIFCSAKTYNMETATWKRVCNDCYLKNTLEGLTEPPLSEEVLEALSETDVDENAEFDDTQTQEQLPEINGESKSG